MRLHDDKLLLSASDLSAHLGCQHRTQLDRRAATGALSKPSYQDPLLEVLQQRGLEHEADYIAQLEAAATASGAAHEVVDLRTRQLDAAGFEATREAMAAGAGVITQAPLIDPSDGRFRGVADVLLKQEEPSPGLGGHSYLVVDTKLASETRAGTILQLCLYTRIVGAIQEFLPPEFWVVSPGRLDDPQRYRTTDYLAFARRMEAQLLGAVDGALPEEPAAPEPVAECDICQWWSRCDKRRRDADHLSFVAGISRLQRRELETRGIETLSQLAEAELPLKPKPERGSAEGYERVREQARVQRESEEGKPPLLEWLPEPQGEGEEAVRRLGLARLPEPSPGDVFLDLEGDPFAGKAGLEYLFGWVTIGPDGQVHYVEHWAETAAEERVAFEALIDFLSSQWKRFPDFAVYHFGAYEPATLKRLMGRHATREDELDKLLRGERFVDLHRLVKETFRIGIEIYGLKQLEAVHGFEREMPLRDASLHKHRYEHMLELGHPEDAPEGSRDGVGIYNRDDCVSTWRLRDWLEARRAERIAEGIEVPRPVLGEGIPSEKQEERSAEIQQLMDALCDGLPDDPAAFGDEERARWLIAHLLEWHRREGKAGWWDFFRLADLPPEELRGEKSGLVGLEHVERIQEGKKLPIDRYRFGEQDHDVRPGRSAWVASDQELGTIEAVDLGARTVDIKKRKVSKDHHPWAFFTQDLVNPKPIPGALARVAEAAIEHGIDASGPFRAARDLLLARPPRLSGGPNEADHALAAPDEDARTSATRLALDLAGGVLPIQGPPGTGKTYTGARVVCALVAAGQKVGITGPSHKVIRNLLEAIVEAAHEAGQPVRIVQRVREKSALPKPEIEETTASDGLSQAFHAGTCDVAAGTVWSWSREDVEGLVDTLVIDEAGQLSLANAVAAATAARNVLLLGDPQQLEQPIQGSHPLGCDSSVLEHLLAGHDTIPADRGLFLATTWRLAPPICAFTSELFYEGRLGYLAGCAKQRLTGPGRFAQEQDGTGLWLEAVEHGGNTSRALEEVEHVHALVSELTADGAGWIDLKGKEHALRLEDLRIVSPYNAQVAALKARIPEAAEWIGTVDKFQGQEAPVVIYSLTTSSSDEAPRGLEFLFSLNRLNVATSRARCACILVASPALLEAECRTPGQIKLVNALCRYREMAEDRQPGQREMKGT